MNIALLSEGTERETAEEGGRQEESKESLSVARGGRSVEKRRDRPRPGFDAYENRIAIRGNGFKKSRRKRRKKVWKVCLRRWVGGRGRKTDPDLD